MAAFPRQKACLYCADSKRRCDKQLPECQRCLDRDVDCVYPQPKRRRRDATVRDIPVQEFPSRQSYVDANDVLGVDLDLGDWDAMGTVNLDVSLSYLAFPPTPVLPAPIAGPSAEQGLIHESESVVGTPVPWFLQDETWITQHCNEESSCTSSHELEAIIRAVDEMLQCWVRNGHNSFIHRRLYEKGMPACVQDAFTTLAAYHGRTPAVTETILQIAEERSSALVASQRVPPNADGTQGLRAHLARVQALFVYEFIRLFDGSIRARASAERQIPTLRRWLLLMLEAARRYRVHEASTTRHLHHRPLQWTASEFDRGYEASSEMWQLWILTETVRRTHLIIDTVANVFQTMTTGWAECAGSVMITARRGLWEAESTLKWSELSCAEPPLLMPALRPGPFFSQYGAEELDDFVKTYWTFLVGKDKMQCWTNKRATMETEHRLS